MSNPALQQRTTGTASHWEPKFPFDLVVAYEDAETRTRALHLYDHLAQQLLDDYDFQCSWWKFDHLANSTLRQQASDAAAEANMIILCLHGRDGVTAEQRAWIEEWLPRRDGRKSALVAMLGGTDEAGGPSGTSATLNYLRNVARLGRMDFFDHTFNVDLPQRELSMQPPPVDPPRITPPPVVVHPLLYHQMPTPRWGINE